MDIQLDTAPLILLSIPLLFTGIGAILGQLEAQASVLETIANGGSNITVVVTAAGGTATATGGTSTSTGHHVHIPLLVNKETRQNGLKIMKF